MSSMRWTGSFSRCSFRKCAGSTTFHCRMSGYYRLSSLWEWPSPDCRQVICSRIFHARRSGFALQGAGGEHAAVNYGWYAAFLRYIVRSGGWLAPVIAIGEVLIGAALIGGL